MIGNKGRLTQKQRCNSTNLMPFSVVYLMILKYRNTTNTSICSNRFLSAANNQTPESLMWAGYRSWYSDWLRAGRSGDRIQVEARFSAPVQTGPGAHPASCTMGTGSFPGVKSGWGVTLTTYPLLEPWSRKGRAITLLPQWAVRPVQSSVPVLRTRVPFTFWEPHTAADLSPVKESLVLTTSTITAETCHCVISGSHSSAREGSSLLRYEAVYTCK